MDTETEIFNKQILNKNKLVKIEDGIVNEAELIEYTQPTIKEVRKSLRTLHDISCKKGSKMECQKSFQKKALEKIEYAKKITNYRKDI